MRKIFNFAIAHKPDWRNTIFFLTGTLYRIPPSVRIQYITRTKYLPATDSDWTDGYLLQHFGIPVTSVIVLLDDKNVGSNDGIQIVR